MPIKRSLATICNSTFNMLQRLLFPFEKADVVTTILRVSVSVEYRGLTANTTQYSHLDTYTMYIY